MALQYVFRMIDEASEGNAGDVPRFTFQLPVHHDGIIGYGAYACVAGCTASVFFDQCAELRDDIGTVSRVIGGFTITAPAIKASRSKVGAPINRCCGSVRGGSTTGRSVSTPCMSVDRFERA